MKTARPWWLCTGIILICVLNSGQMFAQRLYDKEKDDQAQEARKLAEAVTSGLVFEKQLKNMKLITQQDFATYFMSAKRKMDLEINSFHKWRSVGRAVQYARDQVIEPDPYPNQSIDQIRAGLKKEREEAAAKLKELKVKVAPPDDESVPVMFERLGNLESLFGFAEDLLTRSQSSSMGTKQLLEGVKEIEETLVAIKELYASYLAKMDQIDEASKQLTALKVPMQKVAIARLQVEEQHWKNVGAIQARRAADQSDVLLLISEFEEGIKVLKLADSIDALAGDSSNRTIEQTIDQIVVAAGDAKAGQPTQESLRAAVTNTRGAEAVLVGANKALARATLSKNRKIIAQAQIDQRKAQNQLDDARSQEKQIRDDNARTKGDVLKLRKELASLLDVLHLAAALSAHGSTPANLASLRLAQEEHRYSIRKSAVLAQAYEATVNTGVQRLALYYKSGIKPEKIAQLIYSAATVAVPPAILAK